jgi:WD40 repeat protein
MNKEPIDDTQLASEQSNIGVTKYIGEDVGQVALHKAEQAVGFEWKPDDVILDLYEVRTVTEGFGEDAQEKDFHQGGFGRVYKVWHRKWQQEMAVKTPKREAFDTPSKKTNFINECETWIELGLHPHIAACYYVRELGGVPRVFSEYAGAGTLDDWIRSEHLYKGEQKEVLLRMIDIAIQFAWGLHYAHEYKHNNENKGIVHQDVKPLNLLVMKDEPMPTVKVTDFGLAHARALPESELPVGKDRNGKGSIMVAQSGGMTLAYCSPEQAAGQPLTRRTDVWSWGLSILTMFTGEVTWAQENVATGPLALQILEQFLEHNGEEEKIPAMPKGVADLLRQCFKHNPDDRPHSMQDCAAALIEIYQSENDGKPYPRTEPKAADLRADALNNRGVSYLDLGKEAEARKQLEEALNADPQHLDATFNLGYLRWNHAEILSNEFIRFMRELENSKGTDPDYWRYLAWIYLEQGNIEEIEKIRQLHKIDDKSLLNVLESKNKPIGRFIHGFNDKSVTSVNSVCFSSDGEYILSGGTDNIIKLWDIKSGELKIQYKNHNDHVTSVCFSPDGTYVLSGSRDRTIRRWETISGKEKKKYEGHIGPGFVNSVCFSPDGKYILSGGGDKTIRLWDTESGEEIKKFEGHTSSVNSVCFSPDGKYILSGAGVYDQTIRLWESESGKVRKFNGCHTSWVLCVCFSPNDYGKYALSSGEKTIRLWDVESGEEIKQFKGQHHFVNSVCFSPDGKYLLSSEQENISLWDVESGKEIRQFKGHTVGVNSVSFTHDGRYAVSGCQKGEIKLWEIFYPVKNWSNHPYPVVSRIKQIAELTEQTDKINRVFEIVEENISKGFYSKAYQLLREMQTIPGYECDKRLLTLVTRCGIEGKGKRISLKGSWNFFTFSGHTGSVTSACFSPNGRYVLSNNIGADNTFKLWDIESCREIKLFENCTNYIPSVCFSPDGKYIISGSWDKTIRYWDIIEEKEKIRFENNTDRVNSVSISPDGRYALSGSDDKIIKLWDIEKGNEKRQFVCPSGVNHVSFSPDGKYILSGSRDNIFRFWDIAGGIEKKKFTVEPSSGDLRFVCFSRDSRYVLLENGNYSIKLCEIETGREIRLFDRGGGNYSQICFSPDGKCVLSGCEDKTIRLLEIENNKEIQQFNGHTVGVSSVCFSPDGQYVLSGSGDKTIRIWETKSGREMRLFEGHAEWIFSVSFSPDGRYILSGSKDRTIKLWELDWEWEF